MLTAGVTESIGPTLVNDLRANVSWQSVNANSGFLSLNGGSPFPSNLLFPSGYSPQNSSIYISDSGDSPAIPTIQFGLAGASRSRQIQAVDQLSWTRGTHQLKFGADYRLFNFLYQPPKTASTFTVSDLAKGQILDVEEQVTPVDLNYRVPAFSLYAQDTWHAFRRLTITWGTRWELEPAPRATNGGISVYKLANLTDLSSLTPVTPGSAFYRTRHTNFAPRVGLAWQMLDHGSRKTVLRAGSGIFYDSAQGGFENLTATPSQINFYFSQPPLNVLSSGAQPDAVFSAPVAVVAAPGYTRPRTYEWNVTLEQSLGQQTFSVAYTGSVGRRLLGTAQGVSAADQLSLLILGNYFSSSYNALQLQFNRRMSKRVQAMISWTWSHAIDNLSDETGDSVGPLDTSVFLNPNQNRGDSDFDVRQSLHGALFFALPAPRTGRIAMLQRNWTASSIFFARTALPTNVVINPYESDLRPDIVPGQPLYLYGSGYPGGESFNAAALAAPPAGVTQGDLGRNVLHEFGAWEVDLALHREFRLSDHTRLQFRAEAFNALNHPNFASPAGGSSNPQQIILDPILFGQSSSSLATAGLSSLRTLGQLNQLFQIGGPRSLQLALRLTF